MAEPQTIAPDIRAFVGGERPDLEPLVQKWAAILKLQDWEVLARYARDWDIRERSEGQATISIRLKTCTIRILDPVDYCDSSWPQDVERVLVHELIHCHLEFFGKAEGVADDMREQAVESLTRALIGLDRRSATLEGAGAAPSTTG